MALSAGLCADYLSGLNAMMQRILDEETDAIGRAADRMARQIAADKLVHVFGPGGHSNLAAQEIFFRPGGLMHVSAILDEGTLLSNGALRSTAMERTPGYGRVVIADHRLVAGDLLVLVNAYGVNAAVIDAALEARARGVFVIGVSSRSHSRDLIASHPARHPSKTNLHDLVDIAIDSKVPTGDTLVQMPDLAERVGSASSFANGFVLNCLVIETVSRLKQYGITPPIWQSSNAPGGEEANARFVARFHDRVRKL